MVGPRLRIGTIRRSCAVRVLTLDGCCEPCAVDTDLRGRSLTILDANP
jgi:uncharacterized metal-binding protein